MRGLIVVAPALLGGACLAPIDPSEFLCESDGNCTAPPGTVATCEEAQLLLALDRTQFLEVGPADLATLGPCLAEDTKAARALTFTIPSMVSSWSLTMEGDGWTPTVALYRDSCDAASELGCWSSQQQAFETNGVDLAPGRYFLVVSTSDDLASASPQFTLDLHGRLDHGAVCDPMAPGWLCTRGGCLTDGDESRCGRLDCPDGIDSDLDGFVDEDTCPSAPMPSCPSLQSSPPVVTVNIVIETPGVACQGWMTLADAPETVLNFGVQPPKDEELCRTAHAIVVYGYVREVGAHRVRATASDIDGHLTACEFDVTIE